ncbi:MAG TPA: hypothetical protein VMV46_14680 [Thermoanaerobaculia bacterium]|nr:hypothetical protein [Thermoanaerobaculia bacterium]
MNLKVVHVVFVVCSTLLAFVFGGWSLGRDAGAGGTAAGALAFAFGVAMIVYGVWFWRKIRTPEEERRRRLRRIHKVGIAMLVAWALAGDGVASACEVCYGNASGPLLDAARAGVFLLFGLVLAIQACLVAFFLVLRKRARDRRKEPIPPWWSTVEEPIEP